MTPLRRSWWALAVGAAVLAAPTACASDSGPTITIYSGRTAELIGPLLEQYADESGVDIDVRYGDTSELALLLETEGDKSGADVFLSQSPGATGYLDELGLLAELSPEVLDAVAPGAHAEDGRWVGFSGRQRVLVYNVEQVDESELPDSVFDLTGPEWKGRVGVAPSNGSFQDFVTAMRQDVGDDETAAFLEGLAANDVETFANNNAIVEAVGRGEVDVGLVNHYYNERVLKEDPDAASRNHYFAADDIGSLAIVTAASVLASADDKAAAEDLVRFLLSTEAQEFFRDETLEYPLAAGVDPPEGLPPLDFGAIDGVDLGSLGGGLKGTLDLIEASGLND
jgi:iron(III) transport system substrate-binding protein